MDREGGFEGEESEDESSSSSQESGAPHGDASPARSGKDCSKRGSMKSRSADDKASRAGLEAMTPRTDPKSRGASSTESLGSIKE